MLSGPVPNAPTDLSRERDANRAGRPDAKKGVLVPCSPLPMDRGWTQAAKNLYTGMIGSGQAAFYQASDWALLWFLCDQVSRYTQPRATDGKAESYVSGQALAAINNMASRLLFTEGDRRSLRIELEAPKVESDEPTQGQVAVRTYQERQKLRAV